jgi:hypothetical protein
VEKMEMKRINFVADIMRERKRDPHSRMID